MSLILKELENNTGSVAISRNEMAQKVGCVPSQISYVLSSRFTIERGFLVKSRRGSSGYIEITKIKIKKEELLASLVHSIGEKLDEEASRAILLRLFCEDIITKREHAIMLCALCSELSGQVRACIFKAMLISIL